jgi:hypothetical protein
MARGRARIERHGANHAPGGADPIVGLGGALGWDDVGSGVFGSDAEVLETYSLAGTLLVSTGVLRWYPIYAGELLIVHAALGGAPAGSALTLAVKKNGAAVSTPSIAAGAHTATDDVSAAPVVFVAGDFFTVDVTAVGSSSPGTDLVVQLWGTIG